MKQKVLKIEVNIYKEDGTDVDEELGDLIVDKFFTVMDANGCVGFMFANVKDNTGIEEES